ncbi:MAG: hypothetical protein ACNA8R_14870 [Nitriliruptoraceae bacterium]
MRRLTSTAAPAVTRPCPHTARGPEQLLDPKLKQTNRPGPGEPTGIRYLDALVADHTQQQRRTMSYQTPDPDPDGKEAADDR